nr:ATP-binding cassette domain-containing protein [Brevibacterium marinum]
MTLELDRAGFTYRGASFAALTEIDLSLAPGQMHAILGASQAGTSTLGRLITGLLDESGTSAGTVHVAGTAVMLGDDPEAQLSGMTSRVGDEVQLPGRLHGHESRLAEHRARKALASLGIAELWDRRLETLSGGQRQLVALSGLLSLRPSLLILDQPSLSLDPDTRRLVATVLLEFCSTGGSVLTTGHQFDEVAAASHRLSILASGRLHPRGTDVSSTDWQRHGIWDTRPREPFAPASTETNSPTIAVPSPTTPSALAVRDLTVSRGSITVIDGIDLDVGAGELVTIMGSNGAGKSTLLRSLVGLLDTRTQTPNTITVDDCGGRLDLGGTPAHRRAPHLGWVGQDPGSQLFAATVREELTRAAPLPQHRRRDRAKVRAQRQEAVASAMVETGLSAVSETHPYDLSIDRRKDLVLASALIPGPQIIVLDEPTLGRDHTAIRRLNMFIDGFLGRGGAILTTTHDWRWATEKSDRILRLCGGRL